MTEHTAVIFFASTTIGWGIYHFFVVKKMKRALETTLRMAGKKSSRHSSLEPGEYVVLGGGGGGGGSGQVSIKYPAQEGEDPDAEPIHLKKLLDDFADRIKL